MEKKAPKLVRELDYDFSNNSNIIGLISSLELQSTNSVNLMPWFGAGAYNALKCKHDKIRKVARRGSFEFRAISGTGSNLACAQ